MKTEIIYEDQDILVVKKPAGLATQTARVGQQDVVSELKNYLASASGGRTGQPYLGIIHRLDQPVEGLLVFAKHPKAAAALTAQLSGKQEKAGKERRQDVPEEALNKQYYAVFCGKPDSTEGTLVDKLYKEDGRAVVAEDETSAAAHGAKRAVLHYNIVQTAEVSGQTISLARIRIETGRFHQIRVQMAHAGMALLGDAKYADEETKAVSKRLGISTAALCAYGIAFVHPVNGKELTFQIKPSTGAFSYFSL